MNRLLHFRTAMPALGLLLLVILAACDRQDNHWDAFDPAQKLMVVQADTLRLAEGGEALAFNVSLLMVPDDTVRIVVTSPDSQLVVEPDTVVFVPVDDDWARPRAVTLLAADDWVDEGPHTAAVSVMAISADADYDGQGGAEMVPAAITDNDRAGVHVTETALTVVESVGGVVGETYRVHLLSRPVAAVTVTATEATAEPSFHLDPGSLVFTVDNWDVEQEIRVWAEMDNIDANNLDLVVAHTTTSTDPNYASGLAVPSVDVALLDDTLPPTASLELVVPGGDTMFESGVNASLEVAITLNHRSVVPTTVRLVTRDGTALGGADFQIIDQNVVFAPGDPLSRTFAVSALNDILIEEAEVFQVAISGVSSVIVGEQSYLDLNLVDDDRADLTISTVDIDEDAGGAAFVISMPAIAQFPISFTLRTSNGTAGSGTDYEAIDGIFAIAPGQTQRVVPLEVRSDSAHEPDETLTASLSNLSTNAFWDEVPGQLTIRDDDPQTISFVGLEVAEDQPSGLFVMDLAASYNEPLVLRINTMNGDGVGSISGPEDAEGGPDFDTVSNAIWTIPAGTTRMTYLVSLTTDFAAEAHREYFRLAIQSASHPGFTGLTATCTIVDSDQPRLVVGDAAVLESDGSAAFGVSVLDAVGNLTVSLADISFDYTTVNQTAESGSDYVMTSGTLVIPAGVGSGAITVPILEDALDDDNESFVLDLTAPVNATITADGSPPFCTITDNEFAILNLTQVVTTENEGALHEFKVALTVARQEPTGFTLDLLPGNSGGLGVDYTFGSFGYRVIPPYVTSLTFQVPFLDDKVTGESDEVVTAEISDADLAMGITSLSMTIVDAPLVEIQPAIGPEGSDLIFNVVLTAPTTVPVTFVVQYLSGTADILADINSSDTGPFTIPAGDWLTTVAVPTVDGDGVEAAVETFTVTLFGPGGAVLGAVSSAIGSIQDVD